MHGYGEFRWKDGKHYIGYHSHDKKSGFGIYFQNSCQKAYIGFWSDGKRHGVGKYLLGKTSKFGFFNKGSLVKWFTNEKDAIKQLRQYEGFNINIMKLEISDVNQLIQKKLKLLDD